jgi:hypothetical protein
MAVSRWSRGEIMTRLPADFLQSPPLRFRLAATLRKTWLAREYHRHHRHRRADVALLSFPKAGRTWLRLMLGRCLAEHFGVIDAEPFRINRMADHGIGIPCIRINHDDNPQVKTPGELVKNKSEYRDLKVIYMVRDIRDLAVSNYFEFTKRRGQMDRGLPAYLRSRRGSVATMIRHYNIWAENRGVPAGFHLVRYEDLHANTEGRLRDLLSFIGVHGVAGETIRRAVEFGSFDNMRHMELNGDIQHRGMRSGDPGDPESYKTRKGKVGGYVDYMTPDDIEWTESMIRDQLDPFYAPDLSLLRG